MPQAARLGTRELSVPGSAKNETKQLDVDTVLDKLRKLAGGPPDPGGQSPVPPAPG